MSISYTGPHKKGDIKKVVLAYSGGLDTSVILKWLQTAYGCEVVTFTADLGQGEELEPVRGKAAAAGVKEIFIDDLREEFVRDFVFPMFRANSLYEGTYLLGTSIARPLIARRQIEIAREVGADAVSHGATGKGNDQVCGTFVFFPLQLPPPPRNYFFFIPNSQPFFFPDSKKTQKPQKVRFELGYYGLQPDIKVISPWREWDLNSRSRLISYAEERGIAVPASKR